MSGPRPARRQLSLFEEPAEVSRDLPAGPPRRASPGAVEAADHVRDLADRMPSGVFLGTSSWSFPGWAGIVYDREWSKARLARQGLAAYARHPLLRSVGIDRTYYAPIGAKDFAAYAAAVPSDFRFLVKAHEECTVARFPNHDRYGVNRGAKNGRFLDPDYAVDVVVGPAVEGLGDRAGVLLFQFPPQSYTWLGGVERFAEKLHAFLTLLPTDVLYAIELRNAELLTIEYRDALRDAGACHCFNVHPSTPDPVSQRRLLEWDGGPATVVRWMLGSGFAYEAARERYQPFNRIVDEDTGSRENIAELCVNAVARQRRAFVIINNKAEGSAPLSAVRLAERIVTSTGRPPQTPGS